MRGVVIVLLAMVLGSVCFVDAYDAEVLVIDDMGSFSGAVLRIKASASGDVGDKIFPFENLARAGVVKFNVETSLSEIFLNILIIKDGEVVNTIDEGPFVVDGSQILIDLREGAEDVASVVLDDVENVSGVVELDNISLDVNDSAEEDKVSVESVKERSGYNIDLYVLYLIGGVLTFIVLMVAWFRFKHFRGWLTRLNYFSSEGELARIESKIRRKDELIDKIKKNKARERKIKLARKKLERENEKLEKMIRKKISKKSKK